MSERITRSKRWRTWRMRGWPSIEEIGETIEETCPDFRFDSVRVKDIHVRRYRTRWLKLRRTKVSAPIIRKST